MFTDAGITTREDLNALKLRKTFIIKINFFQLAHGIFNLIIVIVACMATQTTLILYSYFGTMLQDEVRLNSSKDFILIACLQFIRVKQLVQ